MTTTNFISLRTPTPGYNVVAIDGSAPGVQKTLFPDGSCRPQLIRAQSNESGFSWEETAIQEVAIKHMVIYDELDVTCLTWFIRKNIKITMTDSFVDHRVFDKLINQFTHLVRSNLQVPAESWIRLNGQKYCAYKEQARDVCEDLGFQVFYV